MINPAQNELDAKELMMSLGWRDTYAEHPKDGALIDTATIEIAGHVSDDVWVGRVIQTGVTYRNSGVMCRNYRWSLLPRFWRPA